MAANGIKPHEAAILDWLGGQKQAMLELLETVVNIDSGSYDKAGVDAVGAQFIGFFTERGLPTSTESHETFGNAIHVRLDDSRSNEKPIVLMGHRDTVFPKGEVARRPFKIEGGRAYGPGVSDMKSGLVMNAFVLDAFKRFGGAPAPLAGLITSDEEIASPSSRPVIERVAREARCIFNAEPGRPVRQCRDGPQGRRIHARRDRGSGRALRRQLRIWDQRHWRASAQDRQAACAHGSEAWHHGQRRHRQGRPVCEHDSAVGGRDRSTCAMSRRETVQRPSELSRRSWRRALCRAPRPSSRSWGSSCPSTRRLPPSGCFAGYQAASGELGLQVKGEFTGGCADSGFTAAVGCPTICATGPVGAKAHTPEEYLEVDSMVPRAQALALAILRLEPAG